MSLYRLYGLTIDSELDLPALPTGTGPAEFTVRWGLPREIPSHRPQGRVLSQVDIAGITYWTTRTREAYWVRFPNVCDAVISETLDSAVVVPASPEQRPLAEILFVGNIMAKIVTLAGGCILHASAAATNSGALAYVGPPGAGKSTCAALTCAAGASLITDDVLRLRPLGRSWYCAPGTAELRLRQQAAAIAGLLDGTVENTIDRRVGVTMGLCETEVPLRAILFPRPSRTASAVAVERLTEHDALMQLTRFPRVLGWKDPQVLGQSFRWNARLAREVPTFTMVVPWGPPFDPGLLSDILDRIEDAEAVGRT